MKIKQFIYVFSFIILAFSCSIPFNEDIADTPQENFDYLWNQIDQKYSFFEEKNKKFGLDWNNVKTKYGSMIKDEMSEEELFKVLGDMVLELKDGHSNLIASINTSATNLYDKPGQPWGYSDNYDDRIVLEHYLPKDYFSSGAGTFIHARLKNNNDIAYIRYGAFNGKVTSDPTMVDFVFDKYKDAKALILDLRENSGGAVTDMQQLVSRLIDKEELLGHVRDVTGSKHDDFSEFKEVKMKPYEGSLWPTDKPIMLLTDRMTYSAGSFFTLFVKDLPNVTTVGTDTGGGLGLPNGGELPNGWAYRFSITQTADKNKANTDYENGVPVEEKAVLDKTKPNSDEVIDKAIELIKLAL